MGIAALFHVLAAVGPISGSAVGRLDLRLDRIGAEDGLAHAAVHALAQDREGFIWVGTPVGLDRWDGYGAVHFDLRGKTPAARSVLALAVDHQDRLWVGTSAGLLELDRGTGHGVPWPVGGGDDPTQTLLVDRAGRLWIGAGPRLFVGAPELGFQEVDYPRRSDEDPRAAIAAIEEADDGVIRAVLRELDPPRTSVLEVAADWLEAEIEPAPAGWGSASTLYTDVDGNQWLDAWHHRDPAGGWVELDPKAKSIRPSAICAGSDDWVWFASDQGLVLRIGGELVAEVRPDPSGTSWQQNHLQVCLVDRGGRLWLGSLAGLLRWDPFRKPFRWLRHDPSDPRSLSGDPVSALYETDGLLWVGVYGAGLSRLELATGLVMRHGPAGAPLPCDNRVWSIADAVDGTLWVGTETGLCRFAPSSGEWRRVDVPGLALEESRIKAIAAQGDGTLWIGTNYGLLRFDPETRAATRYRAGPEPGGLASRQVSDLLLEGEHTLWIASTDGDLQALDLRSGSLRHFSLRERDRPDPVRAGLYDLELAPDGTLWVATHVGLARLDREQHQLLLEIAGAELPGSIVYSVLAEGGEQAGVDPTRLWLGTSRGFAAVRSLRPTTTRAYDLADGIGNLELNRHAALRLASGELAFGGMSGLTLFDPAEIHDDPEPPPLVLTAVEVLGRDGERSLSARGLDRVELGPGDLALSVEVVALGFSQPHKQRYRHRLEGFDRDWVEVGTRRTLRYTNLPPGRYLLRVVGSNHDGVWNTEGARVEVVVLPPWWRTWWFRAFTTIVLTATLWLAYHLRLRHLRSLERMRLRIAGDLHDELGSELSGIALVSSMLATEPHLTPRDRERLTQVQRGSVKILQGLRDIVWYIDPEQDTVVSLVARMRSDAGPLLGDRECAFEVELEEPEASLSMDQRRHWLRAFKEILHNVSRHAGPCAVRVRVRAGRERFELRVVDDGVGFDPAAETTGTGLRSLRHRASQLGAQLEVASAPGAGTAVTMTCSRHGPA